MNITLGKNTRAKGFREQALGLMIGLTGYELNATLGKNYKDKRFYRTGPRVNDWIHRLCIALSFIEYYTREKLQGQKVLQNMP